MNRLGLWGPGAAFPTFEVRVPVAAWAGAACGPMQCRSHCTDLASRNTARASRPQLALPLPSTPVPPLPAPCPPSPPPLKPGLPGLDEAAGNHVSGDASACLACAAPALHVEPGALAGSTVRCLQMLRCLAPARRHLRTPCPRATAGSAWSSRATASTSRAACPSGAGVAGCCCAAGGSAAWAARVRTCSRPRRLGTWLRSCPPPTPCPSPPNRAACPQGGRVLGAGVPPERRAGGGVRRGGRGVADAEVLPGAGGGGCAPAGRLGDARPQTDCNL